MKPSFIYGSFYVNSQDDHAYLIEKRGLKRAFDTAANGYDHCAILQQAVMHNMLARLDLIRLHAKKILELGSGTGNASRVLARKYAGSQVIQLDLSTGMLQKSRTCSRKIFSRQRFLCADAERLPLRNDCIDLAFSSLMLQWCNDLDAVLKEVARVVRPGGLFIFATLGPDTLKELRLSWEGTDNMIHVNAFIDMHDVGDALVRAGLDAPVLDVERITMSYDDVYTLMRDLKRLGAHNVNTGRRRTLTGKNRIWNMKSAYEQFRLNGRLPATYEVVYGHAWMPEPGLGRADTSTEIKFPIASITRRSRHE